MDTQIVILAAGKGTRMGNSELPKVLVPLKGKPVITYLLDEVAKLKDAPPPVIVVGYKSTMVKEELGKQYKYALQRDQLGTAHAVWSAASCITEKNVLVLYGDMPFIKKTSLKKLINLHNSQEGVISMFTSFVPNFEGPYAHLKTFGRIIRNQFNAIVKIQEYSDASESEKKIKEINPGIYLFNSEWLWNNIDKIDNNNALGEFYLTDIVEVAIQEGETVHSATINPKEILGINTIKQLEQASTMLR
jgi:bifunctional UDP-N-acetylglucosamine pyrophosphorylase/glucosamine-1-phosphate N-acetyltransferase